MIITRVKVTNWRGLSSKEISLQPGVNVLRGDNERGKSSLVEAIQKALHWDSTAKKKKDDRLETIPPVADPNARPEVEIELQGVGVSATVVKVVADKSTHRKCELSVRQNGKETKYKSSEAEAKLAELLGAGGCDPDWSFSEQGKHYDTMRAARPLPVDACLALSVGESGALLQSKRLETVRAAVDVERTSKLGKKVSFPVRDSALASTEAAGLRKELEAKSQALALAKSDLAEVEELRRDIVGLQRQIEAMTAQKAAARQNLDRLEEQSRKQERAEKTLAQCREAFHAQQAKLVELERRRKEIDQLTSSIVRLKEEIDEREKEADELRRQHVAAEDQQKAATRTKLQREALLEESQRLLAALTARRELFERQEKLRRAEQDLLRLQELHAELAEAQQSLRELGSWPQGEQIGQWRAMYSELQAIQREASGKLQLDLELRRPFRIEWVADSSESQSAELVAGQRQTLNAVRSLQLTIEQVGKIQIRCGAQELVELVQRIQQESAKLDQILAVYGITSADLPGGFARLEELFSAGRDSQKGVDDAQRRVKDAEKQAGSREKVEELVSRLRSEVRAAQTRWEPLAQLVPESLDAEALDGELAKQRSVLTERDREVKEAAAALERFQERVASLAKELAVRETTLVNARTKLKEAERTLEKLLADSLSESDRTAAVDQLRLDVAKAQDAMKQAEAALTALGPKISEAELAGHKRSFESIDSQVNDKSVELGHKRGELDNKCGNDPQGRIETLDEEVKDLEQRLSAEERKLASVLLLDELLTAERRRQAQVIAEPLNQRVGPWLSQIRGVPTRVVVDDEGARISALVTQRNGSAEQLPFSELSEGMKEQISFLLRLTLARILAAKRGQPQFVILDDPLTETSPKRRPEMFRVLSQAAEDLQILFVTCHEDVLSLLPGQVHFIDV